MVKERLFKQLEFIVEIDKLKKICRQSYLVDGSRKENDAEHSWHLALMALLLSEYDAENNLDLIKVLKMVLIHDIVEIDAGDTYCYDEIAARDKCAREQKAAERLFGILPPDQTIEMMDLWQEFEECRTPEARFAACLDRLQPLLLNYYSEGKSWKEHKVQEAQVLKRNSQIKETSPFLWEYVQDLLEKSMEKGYISRQSINK